MRWNPVLFLKHRKEIVGGINSIRFLRIKKEDIFLITLNGQEQKVGGFYVFYAPNQAMQEYLVDHREEEVPQTEEKNVKRQLSGEALPIKETFVPARMVKNSHNKEIKNENFVGSVLEIIFRSYKLEIYKTKNPTIYISVNSVI